MRVMDDLIAPYILVGSYKDDRALLVSARYKNKEIL